jgi:hypothetical protein
MKTTVFSLTRSKDASDIKKKERIIKRVNRVTVCWEAKQQNRRPVPARWNGFSYLNIAEDCL